MEDFDKLEAEWLTEPDELSGYEQDFWIEWQSKSTEAMIWEQW